MAGSWGHVATRTGRLRGNDGTFGGMIDNLGDAYESIEEMHGMIWLLARDLSLWKAGGREELDRASVLAEIKHAAEHWEKGKRTARDLR